MYFFPGLLMWSLTPVEQLCMLDCSKNTLHLYYTVPLSSHSFQHPSQTVCVSFLLPLCPLLLSPFCTVWSPSKVQHPALVSTTPAPATEEVLTVNTVNIDSNIISRCQEILTSQMQLCIFDRCHNDQFHSLILQEFPYTACYLVHTGIC